MRALQVVESHGFPLLLCKLIGGEVSNSAKYIIAALLALNLWFAMAIIRIENQRYALSLGMCPTDTPEHLLNHFNCIEKVETRTNPVFHLIYGLGIL